MSCVKIYIFHLIEFQFFGTLDRQFDTEIQRDWQMEAEGRADSGEFWKRARFVFNASLQEQLIGSDKKIRNSYSAYEQRRNSRIVEQTELLKKVQKEQEEKEAERMARIEKRRNER